MKKQPSLWIFAGVNGSGKSTLVERFSLLSELPIVNPDNVAKIINPNHNGEVNVIVTAAKKALQERAFFLKHGLSFGIETTLSGKQELKLMKEAKQQGFKINLIYVGVKSLGQARGRVASRVLDGGHNVSAEDQTRRFNRSLANLPLALAMADRVFIFDNSQEKHRLILSKENEKVKFLAKNMPEWLINSVPEKERQKPKVVDIEL